LVDDIFRRFGTDIQKITTMVITHCEALSQRSLEEYRASLPGSLLKNFLEMVEHRVLLVGFPIQPDYDSPEQDSLKQYHEDAIRKSRMMVLRDICSSPGRVTRRVLMSESVRQRNEFTEKLAGEQERQRRAEAQRKDLELQKQLEEQERQQQEQQLRDKVHNLSTSNKVHAAVSATSTLAAAAFFIKRFF
jgi:hypothetical protein